MNTTITLFTDGGSRGNPGEAAIGAVALQDNVVLFEISRAIGVATNNVAEYKALIEALERLNKEGCAHQTIHAYLDSKLVVEQVLGNWKVKEEGLKPLVAKAQTLAAKFSHLSLAHVRREKNKHADSLVNKALDAL